ETRAPKVPESSPEGRPALPRQCRGAPGLSPPALARSQEKASTARPDTPGRRGPRGRTRERRVQVARATYSCLQRLLSGGWHVNLSRIKAAKSSVSGAGERFFAPSGSTSAR